MLWVSHMLGVITVLEKVDVHNSRDTLKRGITYQVYIYIYVGNGRINRNVYWTPIKPILLRTTKFKNFVLVNVSCNCRVYQLLVIDLQLLLHI